MHVDDCQLPAVLADVCAIRDDPRLVRLDESDEVVERSLQFSQHSVADRRRVDVDEWFGQIDLRLR
jgi:hypothetical protein